MHPWILRNPPLPTYGVFLLLAVVLAWLLARWRARRAGVDPSRIDLLVPMLTGAGLLGASFFGSLTDALTATPVGGAVLFGTLLCASGVGLGYALICRIPLGVMGDVMAAPIALGIAVGRVGCFFAGCCYGKLCAAHGPLMAVAFPRGSFAFEEQVGRGLIPAEAGSALDVYPVQLYEAGLCVVLAVILSGRMPRGAIMGERFLWLGIGYGVIRFGMEFLRGDNPAVAAGLTFSQWLAAGTGVVAVITLLLRRRYAVALRLRPMMDGR